MRTAGHYEIDDSKITARVTAELSAKRKDRKMQSRNRRKKGKGKVEIRKLGVEASPV